MRRTRRAENLRRLIPPAPRVELTVDELMLVGFSATERHAIGDALSRELEQILSGADLQGTFQQSTEKPALNAGSITIHSQRGPGSVGAQVAQAVYGSLTVGGKGGNR